MDLLNKNRIKTMNNNLTLSVVIPCFNEALNLPEMLPALKEYCNKNKFDLIIINDGSTDNSYKILKNFSSDFRFELINHAKNKGYGAALKSGFKKANTDFCVSFDADGQHNIDDIEKLFSKAKANNLDLVIGKRSIVNKHLSYRYFGKLILRLLSYILLGSKIKDLNSGFKMYRSNFLKKYLSICPDKMAFSEVITLAFIYYRHPIMEIPISANSRKRGKSTVSTYTAFETFVEIINIIMLFNPLKIFIPISIIIFLISMLWAIPFLVSGKGLTIGSLFGLMSSLIILLLGLLAEQLSRLRKENIKD